MQFNLNSYSTLVHSNSFVFSLLFSFHLLSFNSNVASTQHSAAVIDTNTLSAVEFLNFNDNSVSDAYTTIQDDLVELIGDSDSDLNSDSLASPDSAQWNFQSLLPSRQHLRNLFSSRTPVAAATSSQQQAANIQRTAQHNIRQRVSINSQPRTVNPLLTQSRTAASQFSSLAANPRSSVSNHSNMRFNTPATRVTRYQGNRTQTVTSLHPHSSSAASTSSPASHSGSSSSPARISPSVWPAVESSLVQLTKSVSLLLKHWDLTFLTTQPEKPQFQSHNGFGPLSHVLGIPMNELRERIARYLFNHRLQYFQFSSYLDHRKSVSDYCSDLLIDSTAEVDRIVLQTVANVIKPSVFLVWTRGAEAINPSIIAPKQPLSHGDIAKPNFFIPLLHFKEKFYFLQPNQPNRRNPLSEAQQNWMLLLAKVDTKLKHLPFQQQNKATQTHNTNTKQQKHSQAQSSTQSKQVNQEHKQKLQPQTQAHQQHNKIEQQQTSTSTAQSPAQSQPKQQHDSTFKSLPLLQHSNSVPSHTGHQSKTLTHSLSRSHSHGSVSVASRAAEQKHDNYSPASPSLSAKASSIHSIVDLQQFFGLQLHKVKGDGNCGFHALSAGLNALRSKHELSIDSVYHVELRKRVVDWVGHYDNYLKLTNPGFGQVFPLMESNKDDLQQSPTDQQAWIKEMERSTVFIDTHAIRVVAELYAVNIVLWIENYRELPIDSQDSAAASSQASQAVARARSPQRQHTLLQSLQILRGPSQTQANWNLPFIHLIRNGRDQSNGHFDALIPEADEIKHKQLMEFLKDFM